MSKNMHDLTIASINLEVTLLSVTTNLAPVYLNLLHKN